MKKPVKKRPRKTAKRKPTFWIKERDGLRWAQRLLCTELTELAIEFCIDPAREWTGEEVAAILKAHIVKRRPEVHPAVMTPGDQLADNAVRLRLPLH